MNNHRLIPRRIYKGKETLSIIGFGGIVVCLISQKEADHYVSEAQENALRFTLGLDITAAIPPGHYELYRRAVDIARQFTALTNEEIESLDRAVFGLTPLFPIKE